MPPLANPAHEKFCHEYLKDFNATRAYIDSGYSEEGAGQSAHKLLNNAEIKARLKELVGEVLGDDKQQIRKIILELQMIAFGDLRDFMDWGHAEPLADDLDGNFARLKNSNSLGEKGRIVAEVKQGKSGTSLKLHDKLKAIDLLGKYYKMWTDKLDLSSSDGTMSPRGMADYYAALPKSEP